MNELVYLAHQTGILGTVNQIMPNASKCLTRSAVESTFISQYQKRVLEIVDIYGMFLVLTIGLGGALLIFMAEYTRFKIFSKKHSSKVELERGQRKEY